MAVNQDSYRVVRTEPAPRESQTLFAEDERDAVMKSRLRRSGALLMVQRLRGADVQIVFLIGADGSPEEMGRYAC